MKQLIYMNPYGDRESDERERIMNFLKRGWKTVCVYGGDRPTVILQAPTVRKKKDAR